MGSPPFALARAPATDKTSINGKVGPGLVLAVAPLMLGLAGTCLLPVRAGRRGRIQERPFENVGARSLRQGETVSRLQRQV